MAHLCLLVFSRQSMPQLYSVSQRRFFRGQSCLPRFRSMPSTDSKPRRPAIPAPRKNWTPCVGMSGRHGSEQVDGFRRNRRSTWPGLCTYQKRIYGCLGEQASGWAHSSSSEYAPIALKAGGESGSVVRRSERPVDRGGEEIWIDNQAARGSEGPPAVCRR